MITLLLSGHGTPVTTFMTVGFALLAAAVIVVRVLDVLHAARWADVAAQRRERWEARMNEQHGRGRAAPTTADGTTTSRLHQDARG